MKKKTITTTIIYLPIAIMVISLILFEIIFGPLHFQNIKTDEIISGSIITSENYNKPEKNRKEREISQEDLELIKKWIKENRFWWSSDLESNPNYSGEITLIRKNKEKIYLTYWPDKRNIGMFGFVDITSKTQSSIGKQNIKKFSLFEKIEEKYR